MSIGPEIVARLHACQKAGDRLQEEQYAWLLEQYNLAVSRGLKDEPAPNQTLAEFGLLRTREELPEIENEFLRQLAQKVNAVAGKYDDRLPLIRLSTIGGSFNGQQDWEDLIKTLGRRERSHVIIPINQLTRHFMKDRVTVGYVRNTHLQDLEGVYHFGRKTALFVKTFLNGLPQPEKPSAPVFF